MNLRDLAQDTLDIVDSGSYTNLQGESVDFLEHQLDAIANTRVYTPRDVNPLLKRCSTAGRTVIDVTKESTTEAAQRLAGVGPEPCVLNFASGKRPGGGFLSGSTAQEEDLCRASGLYRCIERQNVYYEANRAAGPVYTDHIIYSPSVPFFRDKYNVLLEQPYTASVITAPAPNLRGAKVGDAQLDEIFRKRAAAILAVARDNGHRRLVLGAWGCGAFANSPERVAQVFDNLLKGPVFNGAFDYVVFAIKPDARGYEDNYAAFHNHFFYYH